MARKEENRMLNEEAKKWVLVFLQCVPTNAYCPKLNVRPKLLAGSVCHQQKDNGVWIFKSMPIIDLPSGRASHSREWSRKGAEREGDTSVRCGRKNSRLNRMSWGPAFCLLSPGLIHFLGHSNLICEMNTLCGCLSNIQQTYRTSHGSRGIVVGIFAAFLQRIWWSL